MRKGIGFPILLGRREVIKELMQEIEFEAEDVPIIDPKSDKQIKKLKRYERALWENRKRKGITLYEVEKLMRERNYYAAMMAVEGTTDAMLSGFSKAYSSVLKPILESIGKAPNVSKVAVTNLMMTSKGPVFINDTSIYVDPSAQELARIAQKTIVKN